MKRVLIAVGVALALSACNDQFASSNRSLTPVPPKTVALMAEKGMSRSDPILVRLYKKESELEVWKKANDGQYALLKTFPICRWSGQLGPKHREGDRQAPEGFYNITPGLMNPNSAYYLSFDTGYPNAYDRAHGGTGSQLMVHGDCSSRGCYAMTDEGIAEVYAIAREAFSGGQKSFQFQAYPFRMTAQNIAKFRKDPNMPFWANLKQGSDHFELTKREPKVAFCGGRYAFDTVGGGCTPDPTLAPVIAEKEASDRRDVAELVAKGEPAVKLVYADGGQHETFRASDTGASDSQFAVFESQPRRSYASVSRPEALAQGPSEVAIDEAAASSANKSKRPALTKVAEARPGTARTVERPQAPRTVLASADPDQPILTATAPAGEKPFYDRMLGGVLGHDNAPAVVAPVPVAAEVAPRQVELTKTVQRHKPVTNAPKSETKPGPGVASLHGAKLTPAASEKRAETSGLIPGSAPVGPVTTAFKAN